MDWSVAHRRRWTVEEVWALEPKGGERYEVVDGELLVTPAPSFVHQRAVTRIVEALLEYLALEPVGELLTAPFDVVLDPRWSLVQPDVLVLPPGLSADQPLGIPGVPVLLAIEVLSPGTARQDRLLKRPRFQKSGIPCWLVDLESRLVEQWEPDAERPAVCAAWVEWTPPGASAPFRLDVGRLMSRVWGEPKGTTE